MTDDGELLNGSVGVDHSARAGLARMSAVRAGRRAESRYLPGRVAHRDCRLSSAPQAANEAVHRVPRTIDPAICRREFGRVPTRPRRYPLLARIRASPVDRAARRSRTPCRPGDQGTSRAARRQQLVEAASAASSRGSLTFVHRSSTRRGLWPYRLSLLRLPEHRTVLQCSS